MDYSLRIGDGKVYGHVALSHSTTRYMVGDDGKAIYRNAMNPKSGKVEPMKVIEWKRDFAPVVRFDGFPLEEFIAKTVAAELSVVCQVREREESKAETANRAKDYTTSLAELFTPRKRAKSATLTYGAYLRQMRAVASDMSETDMVAMIDKKLAIAEEDGSVFWPVRDGKPVKPAEVDNQERIIDSLIRIADRRENTES